MTWLARDAQHHNAHSRIYMPLIRHIYRLAPLPGDADVHEALRRAWIVARPNNPAVVVPATYDVYLGIMVQHASTLVFTTAEFWRQVLDGNHHASPDVQEFLLGDARKTNAFSAQQRRDINVQSIRATLQAMDALHASLSAVIQYSRANDLGAVAALPATAPEPALAATSLRYKIFPPPPEPIFILTELVLVDPHVHPPPPRRPLLPQVQRQS